MWSYLRGPLTSCNSSLNLPERELFEIETKAAIRRGETILAGVKSEGGGFESVLECVVVTRRVGLAMERTWCMSHMYYFAGFA